MVLQSWILLMDLFKLIYLFYVSAHACVPVRVPVHWGSCQSPKRPEKGIRSPGSGVMGGCGPNVVLGTKHRSSYKTPSALNARCLSRWCSFIPYTKRMTWYKYTQKKISSYINGLPLEERSLYVISHYTFQLSWILPPTRPCWSHCMAVWRDSGSNLS